MLVVNILNESSNPRSFPLFLWYLFLQQKSKSILNFEGERRRELPTLLLAVLASSNMHVSRVGRCSLGVDSACLHKQGSSQNKK